MCSFLGEGFADDDAPQAPPVEFFDVVHDEMPPLR